MPEPYIVAPVRTGGGRKGGRLGDWHPVDLAAEVGGAQLQLSDLTRHLDKLEVTKQYWPEFLSIVEKFPRTATGKIQRFAVRDAVVAKLNVESAR